MTCLEYVKANYPALFADGDEAFWSNNNYCPEVFGLRDPIFTDDCNTFGTCQECWSQEAVVAGVSKIAPDGTVIMDKVRNDRKPRIICISGKAQHGKDTSAGILRDILEVSGYKVLITHYGDLVKYICTTFFGWDGEKDEHGRALLQRIGTDEVRAQRPNYWVDFVVGIVKMFRNEWDYVIIPDCRFPNEVNTFAEEGFDVVHARVIRAPFVSPLTPEQQMHPSETSLDGVQADVYIANFGSLADLAQEIDNKLVPRIIWPVNKEVEGRGTHTYNPVAKAYELLVKYPEDISVVGEAIGYLGEALE